MGKSSSNILNIIIRRPEPDNSFIFCLFPNRIDRIFNVRG